MENKNNIILMVVYNQIQYDARVIRSAEAINSLGEKITVISCNSDLNYLNKNFKSIVFTSKFRGLILLIAFWFYVIYYSIKERKKIKLIYLHDYYMVCIGRFLSLLIRVKWIYDAHELLIERKTKKYSYREYIFLKFEAYNIRNANLVIAANEERKRIIKWVYKLKNTISILNISKLNSNQDLFLSNKEDFIVYQGSMSEERCVSNLIRVLNYLPNNINLKLIGDGPDLSFYRSLVKNLNLEKRVVFTGMIPYSELLDESKMCKLGIVMYSLDSLNTIYCSPNKIYEYAQMNIPMLFSKQIIFNNIINKYKIGEILDCFEPLEKQAKLINDIFSKYDTYILGMENFILDYSYEKEMNKLKKSITLLLNL